MLHRDSRWPRLLVVVSILASLLFIQPAVATAQDNSSSVVTVIGAELSGFALSADGQMVAVNGDKEGPVYIVEGYDDSRPKMVKIGEVPGADDAEGITWVGTDDGANVYVVSSEHRDSNVSQAFVIAVRVERGNYSVATLAGPLDLFTNKAGIDGVVSLDANDGAEGITFAGQDNDELELYSVREGRKEFSTAALYSHSLTVPGLSSGTPRWKQATIATAPVKANLGILDASDIAYNSVDKDLWITVEEGKEHEVARFTTRGASAGSHLTDGVAEMSQPEAITFAPEGSPARASVYIGGEVDGDKTSSEEVRWRFDGNAPRPANPIKQNTGGGTGGETVSDELRIGSPVCKDNAGQLAFTIKNNDSVKHRYYYKAGPPHGWEVEVGPGQTVTRTLTGIRQGNQEVFVARDRDTNKVKSFGSVRFCPQAAQDFAISAPSCSGGAGVIEFTLPNNDTKAHRYYVKAGPPHGSDMVVEPGNVGKLRLAGISGGTQRVYVAQDSPTNIVFEFPKQLFCVDKAEFAVTAASCPDGAGSMVFTIPNNDSQPHRFFVKVGPPHGTDMVVYPNSVGKLRLSGIPEGVHRVYVAQDTPENIVHEFQNHGVDCD